MTTYEPPLKDVPIFDRDNFIPQTLTRDNSPFIQFPKAQGDVFLKTVQANKLEVNAIVLTTQEASKPLLANASKQIQSTNESIADLNTLSGSTSNIQNQLTATPNTFVNDGVPTKIISPKILFGYVTTTSTGSVASVTFDPPFNNTPKVYASVLTLLSGRNCVITNLDDNGFDIDTVSVNGDRESENVNWVAIGN